MRGLIEKLIAAGEKSGVEAKELGGGEGGVDGGV